MSQKLRSLLYLGCFIITAVLYYNIQHSKKLPSSNDEIVETNDSIDQINDITTSTFEDDDVEEDENETGGEYTD